jgi:large subunit ribosomal protein L49
MVGKRKGGVKSGDGRTALRATRHPQIHGSTGVLSSRLETRAAPIQIFCLSDLPIQICAAPSLAQHHTTQHSNQPTPAPLWVLSAPRSTRVMRFPPPPLSFCGHFVRSRFLASNATSGQAHHPTYLVPRNTRGSLPVYSDVRNGGSRYLISIRNVEGNIKVCDLAPHIRSPLICTTKALADELLRDLSDPKLTGSALIKARIIGSNHLVLGGIRRKHAVLDWLVRHGF